MLLRHQSAARFVEQYDANNTYQYIVNREEVQLSWLAAAVADLGAAVGEAAQTVPARTVSGKGDQAAYSLFQEDARDAQAFVDAWSPRVEAMSNARQRGMLRVILGETLEQKRFFELALAGRTDLLGRREKTLAPAHGEVLQTRWIE
jgi:hypothetical protein